jgi:hypothetical protein
VLVYDWLTESYASDQITTDIYSFSKATVLNTDSMILWKFIGSTEE